MIVGMNLVAIELLVGDGQLTGLVLNALPECFVNFRGLERTHWGSCSHFASTEFHRPPIAALLLQVGKKGGSRILVKSSMANKSAHEVIHTIRTRKILCDLGIAEALLYRSLADVSQTIRSHVAIHAFNTRIIHALESRIGFIVAVETEQILPTYKDNLMSLQTILIVAGLVDGHSTWHQGAFIERQERNHLESLENNFHQLRRRPQLEDQSWYFGQDRGKGG